MTTFGDELKRIRKEKGLSIRKLGELSTISHAYLSQIENGKRPKPKPDIVKKLSQALDYGYLDLMDKAGYLPKLTNFEKEMLEERLAINEDYQKHLGPNLESALKKITEGENFLPEVQDDIQSITSYIEGFDEDQQITPAFLKQLVSEADWRQEWIQDLVSLIDNISTKHSSNDVKELNEFLALSKISYKNKILSKEDRQRVIDMLNVLFPEN